MIIIQIIGLILMFLSVSILGTIYAIKYNIWKVITPILFIVIYFLGSGAIARNLGLGNIFLFRHSGIIATMYLITWYASNLVWHDKIHLWLKSIQT